MGSTSASFVNSTVPFDDYRFSFSSITVENSYIQLKDSNNTVVLEIADTASENGVARLTLLKSMLSFNLPYA